MASRPAGRASEKARSRRDEQDFRCRRSIVFFLLLFLLAVRLWFPLDPGASLAKISDYPPCRPPRAWDHFEVGGFKEYGTTATGWWRPCSSWPTSQQPLASQTTEKALTCD
jgi:hypothetical protein